MEITANVRAALLKCKELSDVDGCEHAIGLHDDKEFFLAHGTPTEVRTAKWTNQIKPGDVIVHSHASSFNSLSNGDLNSANHAGVLIYCITADGSIYKANSTKTPLLLLEIMWDSAFDYLEHRTAEGIFYDGIENKTNVIGPAHWVNRMLAGHKYIEYEYELAPQTQAMVEAIDKQIGFNVK